MGSQEAHQEGMSLGGGRYCVLCQNLGGLRSSWRISSLSAFSQILSSLLRQLFQSLSTCTHASHTEECEAAYLQTVATPRDRLCRAKLHSTWTCTH